MNLVKQFNFMKDKDLVMKSKGSELPTPNTQINSASPQIILVNLSSKTDKEISIVVI